MVQVLLIVGLVCCDMCWTTEAKFRFHVSCFCCVAALIPILKVLQLCNYILWYQCTTVLEMYYLGSRLFIAHLSYNFIEKKINQNYGTWIGYNCITPKEVHVKELICVIWKHARTACTISFCSGCCVLVCVWMLRFLSSWCLCKAKVTSQGNLLTQLCTSVVKVDPFSSNCFNRLRCSLSRCTNTSWERV